MATNHSPDSKSLGHEPLGGDVRAVWHTGIGLAALVMVSFMIVGGMMKYYHAVDGVSPGEPVIGQVPMTPDVPKLDPDQPVELHRLRARERRQLAGYGWQDRAAGIAHIPIDRAMQMIAAEGLPELPPPATSGQKPPGGNLP